MIRVSPRYQWTTSKTCQVLDEWAAEILEDFDKEIFREWWQGVTKLFIMFLRCVEFGRKTIEVKHNCKKFLCYRTWTLKTGRLFCKVYQQIFIHSDMSFKWWFNREWQKLILIKQSTDIKNIGKNES